MTELYLVRHAQASFTRDDYDTLSATGIDQSRLLGRYFSEHGIDFDAMLSGSLQRHAQTLDVLVQETTGSRAVPREIHRGLDEYPFRAMMRVFSEIHPRNELVRRLGEQPHDRRVYFRLLRQVLTAWSEGRLEGAPETWSEFRDRVLDARAYVQHLAGRSHRMLIIGSGGAISMLTGSVLDLSPAHVFDLNLQVRNTSITRFFVGAQGLRLAEFNALPHLARRRYADYVTYS